MPNICLIECWAGRPVTNNVGNVLHAYIQETSYFFVCFAELGKLLDLLYGKILFPRVRLNRLRLLYRCLLCGLLRGLCLYWRLRLHCDRLRLLNRLYRRILSLRDRLSGQHCIYFSLLGRLDRIFIQFGSLWCVTALPQTRKFRSHNIPFGR